MVICNVGLSVWLVQVVGGSGVLWASSIATVLFVWIPLGIVAQRLLRTLRSAQLAGPNARVDTSVDTEEFEPPRN